MYTSTGCLHFGVNKVGNDLRLKKYLFLETVINYKSINYIKFNTAIGKYAYFY